MGLDGIKIRVCQDYIPFWRLWGRYISLSFLTSRGCCVPDLRPLPLAWKHYIIIKILLSHLLPWHLPTFSSSVCPCDYIRPAWKFLSPPCIAVIIYLRLETVWRKDKHLAHSSRHPRPWPWCWLPVEGVLANRVRSGETSHGSWRSTS